MTTLDRFDAKFRSLRAWFEATRPNLYEIAHGFVTAGPMAESEIRQIEDKFEISLPPEYRSFLLRFGDGQVGPYGLRRVRDGLTAWSSRPFPLSEPFLGCCAPGQEKEYATLAKAWNLIAHCDGVLSICDYGCAIYGHLVLNGPYRDKIWLISGDAAYYGPFGMHEGLHNEWLVGHEEPTDSPRDFSFFEWYESWLDGQLKSAGLLSI